ncbi:hypothetical protein MNV49_000866 [Pseudohyphozyma bogoriensis]|nr:hypothetical protein MNV49_000866 [Pseudohyphozyma bogoriensis]
MYASLPLAVLAVVRVVVVGSSTTKKKSTSSGGKAKTSSWTKFCKKRTEHYKETEPEWDGAARQKKVREEWKDAAENPKNQK